MHLYSTLLPQAAGRQQTDCVGTHRGNLTPPRISPSCPHCLRLWLDRSIIIRLLTRVVLVSSATMRNSLPQAALWTGGHRSAPSLAIFDTVSRTGGLGASSSVASALLPEGLLVSGRIPLPDIHFSRKGGRQLITDTPNTGQTGLLSPGTGAATKAGFRWPMCRPQTADTQIQPSRPAVTTRARMPHVKVNLWRRIERSLPTVSDMLVRKITECADNLHPPFTDTSFAYWRSSNSTAAPKCDRKPLLCRFTLLSMGHRTML